MRRIAFTYPLTREITPYDIHKLPITDQHKRILTGILRKYRFPGRTGISLSMPKLAEQVKMKLWKVRVLVKQLCEMGFLSVFDTYMFGVGQASSRIFLGLSIIDMDYIPCYQFHVDRVSQRRGQELDRFTKPILIIDQETQEVVGQYFPTEDQRWPVKEKVEDFPGLEEVKGETVEELYEELISKQVYQEGIGYIRGGLEGLKDDMAENGVTLEGLKQRLGIIFRNPHLLACIMFTDHCCMSIAELEKLDRHLKEIGREEIGHYVRKGIEEKHWCRLPVCLDYHKEVVYPPPPGSLTV